MQIENPQSQTISNSPANSSLGSATQKLVNSKNSVSGSRSNSSKQIYQLTQQFGAINISTNKRRIYFKRQQQQSESYSSCGIQGLSSFSQSPLNSNPASMSDFSQSPMNLNQDQRQSITNNEFSFKRQREIQGGPGNKQDKKPDEKEPKTRKLIKKQKDSFSQYKYFQYQQISENHLIGSDQQESSRQIVEKSVNSNQKLYHQHTNTMFIRKKNNNSIEIVGDDGIKKQQKTPHNETNQFRFRGLSSKNVNKLLSKFQSRQQSFRQKEKFNQPKFIRVFENGHKFPSLQTIDLWNNQITDEALKALVENGHKFPSLQEIYLWNNKITGQGLKELVDNGQKFPSLQTINLGHNKITGQGFKALVNNGHKFPSLQTINLQYNRITDKGLNALVNNGHKFPSLQEIYFWNNKITDEGLKTLVTNGHKFPSLQEIDLWNNKITDEGLKELVENGQKFPSLQKIDLVQNKITDEGLKALVENGHKFPILQKIDLWNNKITDEGLKALSLNEKLPIQFKILT